MSKPKLYVGCSLIHAPKEFIANIENLKLELSTNFEILDFVGLNDESSSKIYNHDRKCVLESDFFLAICDLSSIGLGIEIGIALENNKKIILAYHQSSKISKMLLGIPKIQAHQLKYQNLGQIPELLGLLCPKK